MEKGEERGEQESGGKIERGKRSRKEKQREGKEKWERGRDRHTTITSRPKIARVQTCEATHNIDPYIFLLGCPGSFLFLPLFEFTSLYG